MVFEELRGWIQGTEGTPETQGTEGTPVTQGTKVDPNVWTENRVDFVPFSILNSNFQPLVIVPSIITFC